MPSSLVTRTVNVALSSRVVSNHYSVNPPVVQAQLPGGALLGFGQYRGTVSERGIDMGGNTAEGEHNGESHALRAWGSFSIPL